MKNEEKFSSPNCDSQSTQKKKRNEKSIRCFDGSMNKTHFQSFEPDDSRTVFNSHHLIQRNGGVLDEDQMDIHLPFHKL